jgi:hypothetical protein
VFDTAAALRPGPPEALYRVREVRVLLRQPISRPRVMVVPLPVGGPKAINSKRQNPCESACTTCPLLPPSPYFLPASPDPTVPLHFHARSGDHGLKRRFRGEAYRAIPSRDPSASNPATRLARKIPGRPCVPGTILEEPGTSGFLRKDSLNRLFSFLSSVPGSDPASCTQPLLPA